MISYFARQIFNDKKVRASVKTLDECERQYGTKYNGCVVKVDRWMGIYNHYGIYVHEQPFGDESIIHYTEENGGDFKGIVCETPLKDFLQDSSSITIYSCNSQDGVYSGTETVRRARRKLGEGGYSLIFNNCEHFAMWCKTGKAKCHQVENAVKGIGIGALALAVCFGILKGLGGGDNKA